MNNLKLIDLHTHILPNVDDGSKSFEMSLEMLGQMAKNNVTDVFLTPHCQSSVTKVTREEQIKRFNELKEKAKEININLYFGAELLFNPTLSPIYEDYLLHNSNYILIEFRTHNCPNVFDACYNLITRGLKPIIAHIERYEYLTIEDYLRLKEIGVLFQVNANAVMKKRGRKEFKLTRYLLKNNLVDFVASDCHNISTRKCDLNLAYNYLKRRYKKDYLNKIFYENQLTIINTNFKKGS